MSGTDFAEDLVKWMSEEMRRRVYGKEKAALMENAAHGLSFCDTQLGDGVLSLVPIDDEAQT